MQGSETRHKSSGGEYSCFSFVQPWLDSTLTTLELRTHILTIFFTLAWHCWGDQFTLLFLHFTDFKTENPAFLKTSETQENRTVGDPCQCAPQRSESYVVNEVLEILANIHNKQLVRLH
jgi:hypothetical protein